MPLIQEVLVSTNIGNNGVAFPVPRITTLENGHYALTFTDVGDTFWSLWSLFELHGQPVAGVLASPASQT
jgi:hypothetical protein